MYQPNPRVVGTVASLSLHFIVLLYFLHSPVLYVQTTENISDTVEQVKSVAVTILPLSVPDTTSLSENGDTGSTYKYPVDETICTGKDKRYVGVGMIYNPMTHIVTSVPTYYPAFKAGIRLGDMILDPEVPMVNGFITFDVLRSNSRIQIKIKADNICFNEKH